MLEHVTEQAAFELVGGVVHVGERGRPRRVAVDEGVHRHPELHDHLAAHPVDERPGGGVEPSRVQPPGGAGDVHHQVGAALELVGDAQRHPDEAQVGRAQAGEADDPQALVLDRVAQRVDGVVVGDDPVGVVEVTVEEGLGARTDGVEGQRRQAHDVEAHVVDARPDLRVGLLGHDLRGDHA